MVDLRLWEQVPNHEKFEHISDKAKNALIQSMIDDEKYRINEGRYIISSDIMGRPSDIKIFEKLDQQRVCCMRKKKDARYLNVNIDRPVYEELEAFSTHTGISKTAAVQHGLRMYMDDFYRRNDGLKEVIGSKTNQKEGRDDE